MKKESSKVLKVWKQSKDALHENVVSCFKTDLGSIKSALIYMDRLFKEKGIENNASILVNKGLDDFESWEHYYDIMRYEILGHRQAREQYSNEIQKLREEIILLKQDAQINGYGN